MLSSGKNGRLYLTNSLLSGGIDIEPPVEAASRAPSFVLFSKYTNVQTPI